MRLLVLFWFWFQLVSLSEAKLLLNEDDYLLKSVYDYWVRKRKNCRGPSLMPQIKQEKRDGSTNNDAYVAFRRRTEKMQTRKVSTNFSKLVYSHLLVLVTGNYLFPSRWLSSVHISSLSQKHTNWLWLFFTLTVFVSYGFCWLWWSISWPLSGFCRTERTTRRHMKRCWDWGESSVGPSPSWRWSRGEKSPRGSCCTSHLRWWRRGEKGEVPQSVLSEIDSLLWVCRNKSLITAVIIND